MASGDTLLIFHPYGNEPGTANYATLDIRNQHPVLDFDGTTDESAIFSAVMPQAYAAGGVTTYIHYTMSTATAGSITWEAAFERIGDQVLDIDGDSFAAVNFASEAVPGTAGLVSVISIAFTDGADMDSVAAGEAFRLKINRDADGSSGTDDAGGDAELIKVELRES